LKAAQRIAIARLYLNDIGTKIGQLQTQHIARD
jgi:hypothetical protein